MNENSQEKQDNEQSEMTRSFRIMWDGFPHPVLLIQKNRNILDANACARALGVPLGVRCRDISPYPDKCKKYCLADSALESGMTQRIMAREGDKMTATYWIPFSSVASGLYLHFTVDIPDVPQGEVVQS